VTSARDIMTTDVVSVGADTPTQEIARLLLDKGISAVPVIDRNGTPVGMVSEGDLIGRNDADREARRDWWLVLLAEGEALSPEFLDYLRRTGRTARTVMTTPVVTVGEETPAGEIARLLTAHRIKRVPVVRDGRVVGIVSRADLLRVIPTAPDDLASSETMQ
jgi:CBS domain-containing protein